MAPSTTKTATPKAKATTDAGVKKAGRGRPKGGSKNNNARNAMLQMQAFFKENRTKYKDQDFKDQQKSLGADWKKSSKNPKNNA